MLSGAGEILLPVKLSEANVYNSKCFYATLNAMIAPRRSSKQYPGQHLCCDKVYDSKYLRRSESNRSYMPHIKSRDEKREEIEEKLTFQNSTLSGETDISLA